MNQVTDISDKIFHLFLLCQWKYFPKNPQLDRVLHIAMVMHRLTSTCTNGFSVRTVARIGIYLVGKLDLALHLAHRI